MTVVPSHAIPRLLVGSCCLLAAVGCGGQIAFEPNRLQVEIVSQESGEPVDAAVGDVQQVLNEWFGTADEPRAPTDFLDQALLERAAGPVYSDEAGLHFGLYREHCVQCHGLAGQGRGAAAALQNPYPRDFTAGVFKYKSTARGEAPTRADLRATLRHGLAGSSMPAFQLVESEDLDALVEYVAYLAMRGEVERRLLRLTAEVSEWATHPERDVWIDEELTAVSERWAAAERQVLEVSPPTAPENMTPENMEASIAAGRTLFHGPLANCASCHGSEGRGLEKPLIDYDDWTKEWTVRMGIDPQDREKLANYLDAGALKPKPIAIRKLSNGAFRGGAEPEDIFRRLVHGIDGTPMPAVNLIEADPSDGGPAAGLTKTQVWDLVWYVLSLDEVTR